MSQDAGVINALATQGIGPIVNGFMSVAMALIVGFYFCWQEALVCLCMAPFLALSTVLAARAQQKMSERQNDKEKEADLLCGDSLVNLKTIQSFG